MYCCPECDCRILQVSTSWQAISDHRLKTITIICGHAWWIWYYAMFIMFWCRVLLFQFVIQVKWGPVPSIFLWSGVWCQHVQVLCMAGLDIGSLSFVSNFRLWNAVTSFVSIFLEEGFYPPSPFHSEHCMLPCAYFSCKLWSKKLIWCQKCVYFCLYMTPCSLVVVWWEALLLMCMRSWHSTAATLCLYLCA